MSETHSSPSNKPIILAIVLVGLLAAAVHFFLIINIAKENLESVVRVLQLAAIVIYLLILSKFTIDSELIRNYDPGEGSAAMIGRYGGPVGSLLAEVLQIVSFTQLGMLLFQGITFQEWDHNFSVNGPNYWLLTILAILISAKALFDLTSRADDLRYYWSDLAKLVDDNPIPEESE